MSGTEKDKLLGDAPPQYSNSSPHAPPQTGGYYNAAPHAHSPHAPPHQSPHAPPHSPHAPPQANASYASSPHAPPHAQSPHAPPHATSPHAPPHSPHAPPQANTSPHAPPAQQALPVHGQANIHVSVDISPHAMAHATATAANSMAMAMHGDLPVGWMKAVDGVGRTYYINTTTRCSQWTHPVTGHTAYSSVAEYECPSYYEAQYQEQQKEFAVVKFTVPTYSDAAALSPTSPYHPSYYSNIIDQQDQKYQTVLNREQLEGLSMQYIDARKYAKPLTTKQKCCGTFGKFKWLTFLTAAIWAGLIACVVMFLITNGDMPEEIFIAPALPYAIYFFMYVMTAGFIPLFWLCCGRTGVNSEEHIVETLRSSTSGDTTKLLQKIDMITSASPGLTLHVECYHYETRTRQVQKSRTVRNSDGTTSTEHYTDTETYEEKVTTYVGYRRVPIIRFRDISAPSAIVNDIVNECESNMLSVRFKYLYELHPIQKDYLSTLKAQFYYLHSYRDDHTDVTVQYNISSDQPKTDVVVKAKDGGYWSRWFFFFNPISFFLWAYAALYLIPAIVFRSYSRVIPYDNVKYLHIGKPNRAEDVCTFSRPRWGWRWNWW